jgi:hypothetical protein
MIGNLFYGVAISNMCMIDGPISLILVPPYLLTQKLGKHRSLGISLHAGDLLL